MNGKTVPPATPEELRTVVDDLARLIAEQPHEHVYERGMVWESSHCLDCGEQKPPQQAPRELLDVLAEAIESASSEAKR